MDLLEFAELCELGAGDTGGLGGPMRGWAGLAGAGRCWGGRAGGVHLGTKSGLMGMCFPTSVFRLKVLCIIVHSTQAIITTLS